MQRSNVTDLLLPLDETSSVPLYRQVYEGVRGAILEGALAPGSRVPSTRRLAEYLAVSRTTVLEAFEMLVAEGLLEATVGSGSRVSRLVPRPEADADTRSSSRQSLSLLSRRGRRLAELPPPVRVPPPGGPRPFRTGQPPVDGFALEVWRRLAARSYRAVSTADLFHGSPLGLPELREAIATIAVARGIRCDAEQVMVVASAQEAMDLVARVLLEPGDSAWLEDPAWIGGHAALLAAGARVVPVPVDESGIRVDAGISLAPRARLAYVTPSHQYPMGVRLSLERRTKLLDWAREQEAWVLEDDYDSEFRYADHPLPALQGLDTSGRVIYVGTFNKTLFPAVRMAYLILPPALVEGVRRARGVGAQHAPVIDQRILSEFITGGHYSRHIKQVRGIGRERRDALVDAAARVDGLELTHTDTGLHTVGWLPEWADDRKVSAAALRRGVDALPISALYRGYCPRPGLVLGYGSLTPDQIREGMDRLAAALAESL